MARVEIETAVYVLYEQLRHDIQVAAAIRNRLIPQLEQALADTRRAYELCGGSFVELIAVQAELLGANSSDYLEFSIDAYEALVELEHLTGETVLPVEPARRPSSAPGSPRAAAPWRRTISICALS